MVKSLFTVGDIARRFGEPNRDRVNNIIEVQGIEPAARIGNARVFLESDVKRIGEQIKQRRSRRPQGVES